VFGNRSGLVALQVADEVPDEFVISQRFNFLDALNDLILAKIPLSRRGRLDDLVQGLFLADREQIDAIRIAACNHRSFRQ
jgi:hypothetical protein